MSPLRPALKDNEMLSKFFNTQWQFPAKKNERTEKVRKYLVDLGLDNGLSWIKEKSKMSFKYSASAEGGPRSRVRARGTLHSAPPRH